MKQIPVGLTTIEARVAISGSTVRRLMGPVSGSIQDDVVTLTVDGSGPLRFRGGDAVIDSPYFGAALEGQTGDRSFAIRLRGAGLATRDETLSRAADAAATSTSSDALRTADRGAQLVSAYFMPSAALTADDTNFATLSIEGAAQLAAITTETTGSGNWTEDVAVPLTLADFPVVAAGEALTFDVAKTGAGVIVPTGTLHLLWSLPSGRLVEKTVVVRRPADALAADENTQALVQVDRAAVVTGCRLIPNDALTANDTNFATVTLLNGATEVGSVTTEVAGGNWVALTPVPLAISTGAEALLSRGDVLAIDKAITNIGVALPDCAVQLEYSTSDIAGADGAVVGTPQNDEILHVRLVLDPQNL